MTDKAPTGGAAFPVPTERQEHGMDLRDYFAAKALCGLIASPRALLNGRPEATNEDYAQFAYACADAMLKARQA